MVSDVYVPKTEMEDFYKPKELFDVTQRKKNSDKPSASSEKCGVGITFSFDDEENTLVVLKLVKNGPADRSQMISKGDVLLVIDGINVVGHPIEVVHSILKGREGTVTRLLFRQASTGEDLSVALVREEVPEISHYFTSPRVGVGITFETSAVDGSAKVKGVVRDSPADKSGLVRNGDVLYEIDGTNVFREGLDVVANFLLGEPETPVRLLFLRGTRIFVQLTLYRAQTSRQSEMGDILLFAQSSRRIIKHDEDEGGEDVREPVTTERLVLEGGGFNVSGGSSTVKFGRTWGKFRDALHRGGPGA
eukprot:CAMPEP_0181299636 /NCGR_PEP_ID=MMETSP1101-20121128/6455_1 /TAXON_ID=46948 /ORGANISM="Rhodomonas abbreviata, Strain Caron Lab Isolate" /LENGTH=304 /DNA_ID=CAMNT_0023404805 /DNA_START=21 /DNA_END=936 /DNA_ORIENTATION=-